jgi:hypothetical protein
VGGAPTKRSPTRSRPAQSPQRAVVQILLEAHYLPMTRDVERFVDEIRALNPNPYGDFLRLHLGLEANYLASAADARMRGFFDEIRAVVAQSDQSTRRGFCGSAKLC